MSLFERAKKARENKKGFTLVELIVVLVILAILAAIMVPQLTGYIDRAKDKQYEVRCRNILIAAQTILDEEYAKAPAKAGNYSLTAAKKKEILQLAEEKASDSSGTSLNADDPADITSIKTETNSYKIVEMEVTFGTTTTGNVKTMKYSGGTWAWKTS